MRTFEGYSSHKGIDRSGDWSGIIVPGTAHQIVTIDGRPLRRRFEDVKDCGTDGRTGWGPNLIREGRQLAVDMLSEAIGHQVAVISHERFAEEVLVPLEQWACWNMPVDFVVDWVGVKA